MVGTKGGRVEVWDTGLRAGDGGGGGDGDGNESPKLGRRGEFVGGEGRREDRCVSRNAVFVG